MKNLKELLLAIVGVLVVLALASIIIQLVFMVFQYVYQHVEAFLLANTFVIASMQWNIIITLCSIQFAAFVAVNGLIILAVYTLKERNISLTMDKEVVLGCFFSACILFSVFGLLTIPLYPLPSESIVVAVTDHESVMVELQGLTIGACYFYEVELYPFYFTRVTSAFNDGWFTASSSSLVFESDFSVYDIDFAPSKLVVRLSFLQDYGSVVSRGLVRAELSQIIS